MAIEYAIQLENHQHASIFLSILSPHLSFLDTEDVIEPIVEIREYPVKDPSHNIVINSARVIRKSTRV